MSDTELINAIKASSNAGVKDMKSTEEEITSQDKLSSNRPANSDGEKIKVLVRARPVTEIEANDTSVVSIPNSTSLSIISSDGKKSFQCSFDAVLGPQSSQAEVYATVRECTVSVLNGFNSTIFAYGQTGSGKTYSMYGPVDSNNMMAMAGGGGSVMRSRPEDEKLLGVIPRAVREIFELGNNQNIINFSVYCSFVQIYNENLYDMLRDSTMMSPLSIREDGKDIYVQGLSEYNVKSVHDTLQLLRISEENRAIRETYMNQFSSRSHSLFQIYVEQKRMAIDGGEVQLRSKFNLVDLAGSEKWNIQQYMAQEHISELTNINLSLHTLGRCISALAKQSKGKETHVPYRESKLTRLLQDSLGGNSRTFLIATISPAKSNIDESISTLKFADRAKQVMIQAKINEIRPVDHALVMRLQREVEYLRDLLRKHLDASQLQSISLFPSDEVLAAFASNANNVSNFSSKDFRALASVSPSTRLRSTMSTAAGSSGNGDDGEVLSWQENPNSNPDRDQAHKLKVENDILKKELEALRKSFKSKQQLSTEEALNQIQMPGKEVVTGLIGIGTLPSSSQNINASTVGSSSSSGNSSNTAWRREDTVFAEGLAASLQQCQSKLWKSIDQIERVMKMFFKFEIEEDDMKTQVQETFNQFQKYRQEPLIQNEILKKLLDSYLSSIPPSTYRKSFSSMGSSGNLRQISSGHTITEMTAAVGTTGILPQLPSQPKSLFPSQPMQRQQQYLQQLQCQANNSSVATESMSSPGSGIGLIGPASSSSNKLHSSRFARQVLGSVEYQSPVNGQSPIPPPVRSSSPKNSAGFTRSFGVDSSIAMMTPSRIRGPQANASSPIPINLPNVSYRVRGSSSAGPGPQSSIPGAAGIPNQSQVLASGTWSQLGSGGGEYGGLGGETGFLPVISQEEEEELRIRQQMKKAEKRLKKQQQVQEFLRIKQEKAAAIQKAEEDDRKAQEEAERLKDMKRKERAEKLKKKLQDYEQRIKTEAEQIQTLKELGIDPISLM